MLNLIQETDREFWALARWGSLVFLAILFAWGFSQAQSDETHSLGQQGYVVIEAARDSASGFVWVAGPVEGFRSLTWEEGRLTIPVSFTVEDFGRGDIGFPCTRFLTGSGASGQMVISDGLFPVSEPVVLKDGLIELQVTEGELEIRGAMIRYRRPVTRTRDFRSGLLLLAGMTLMIIVLLRRARMKSGQGQGL